MKGRGFGLRPFICPRVHARGIVFLFFEKTGLYYDCIHYSGQGCRAETRRRKAKALEGIQAREPNRLGVHGAVRHLVRLRVPPAHHLGRLFQNFQYVITSGKFWTGVGHVLLYTVIQVPIMIIAALALAMVIDSFVVKHVTGFRLGYFLPYAIPGVVASIIWVYLYNGQISPIVKGLESIGIHVDFFANNVVLGSMANITTWTFTGYNMLIFLAALQAIPHDLYEAARIDGANGFQVAMKIKLPNVRGAALLAMLLSIVGTIQLFNEPQIMSTADPGISKAYTPMMMAMNTSQGTLTPSGDGPASAIAIVMALIAGLLAIVYTLAERKVNE